MNPTAPATSPEHWSMQVGDAAVAHLDIPADGGRERRFEIACAMSVRALDNAQAPWHALRVFANGQLQWQRRIGTQQPAPFDGLDYRFQCTAPVGKALRISLSSDCHGAKRLQMQIEADEV